MRSIMLIIGTDLPRKTLSGLSPGRPPLDSAGYRRLWPWGETSGPSITSTWEMGVRGCVRDTDNVIRECAGASGPSINSFIANLFPELSHHNDIQYLEKDFIWVRTHHVHRITLESLKTYFQCGPWWRVVSKSGWWSPRQVKAGLHDTTASLQRGDADVIW